MLYDSEPPSPLHMLFNPPRLIQPLPVSHSINLPVSAPLIFQKGRDYTVVTMSKILSQKELFLKSGIDFFATDDPLRLDKVHLDFQSRKWGPFCQLSDPSNVSSIIMKASRY